MVLINETSWLAEFSGKTLHAVRTRRHPKDAMKDSVPWVEVTFTDGSRYEIHIQNGLFFEGCLYNALRKAQPVDRILFLDRGPRFIIEVKARSFPLFILRSYDEHRKQGPVRMDYMPFTLKKVNDSNAE